MTLDALNQLYDQLDDLDRRGLIDSPEADAIRDQMEPLWLDLTRAQSLSEKVLLDEIDELKRLIWAIADSQGGEVAIDVVSLHYWRKKDCILEVHEDQLNQCHRIVAKRRKP